MVILMLIFIHNVHTHAHSHAQIQRPCLRSCPFLIVVLMVMLIPIFYTDTHLNEQVVTK